MEEADLVQIRQLLDEIKELDTEIDRCRKRIWEIEMPAYSKGKEMSLYELYERDNLTFKLEAIIERREELMEQLVKELNEKFKRRGV